MRSDVRNLGFLRGASDQWEDARERPLANLRLRSQRHP